MVVTTHDYEAFPPDNANKDNIHYGAVELRMHLSGSPPSVVKHGPGHSLRYTDFAGAMGETAEEFEWLTALHEREHGLSGGPLPDGMTANVTEIEVPEPDGDWFESEEYETCEPAEPVPALVLEEKGGVYVSGGVISTGPVEWHTAPRPSKRRLLIEETLELLDNDVDTVDKAVENAVTRLCGVHAATDVSAHLRYSKKREMYVLHLSICRDC